MKTTLNYIFGATFVMLGCSLDTQGFAIEALILINLVILYLNNKSHVKSN